MNTPHDLNGHFYALETKASLMHEYMQKMDILKPFSTMAWNSYEPYEKRKPYIEILDNLEKEASAALTVSRLSPALVLARKIEELELASVESKREILRSIPTIIVPVAAMYLGVKEVDLHRFKYSCKGLFGARYMNRQCYSMDELHLIAKNPEWMHEYTVAKVQDADELPDLTALDDCIFLDKDLACGFTNMSDDELRGMVRRSYRKYAPYRLSDLEKIRVAKLNSQQH